MNAKLDKLIHQLAEARKLTAETDATMKKIVAQAKDSPIYCEAYSLNTTTIVLVEDLTALIRMEAITAFEADQDKHPHETVEIKMVSIVDIPDLAAVKEWCLHNYTPALDVNRKAIEQAAKGASMPVNLATVTTEPKAYIATDLSKYL